MSRFKMKSDLKQIFRAKYFKGSFLILKILFRRYKEEFNWTLYKLYSLAFQQGAFF